MSDFNILVDKEIARLRKSLGQAPKREEVVAELKGRYEDQIEAWLNSQRETFLLSLVTQRIAQERRRYAIQARQGNVEEQKVFDLVSLYVPARGAHMRLGDMVASDHASVAEHYEILEAASQSRGEFHRYLERAVGDRVTRDALSADVVSRRMAAAYNTERQIEFARATPKGLSS